MRRVRELVAVFRRRDEGGATAVEFALVMLPLLYLVFGIIQYGLYFYAAQSGTHAAGDAVRRIVVGDCKNESTELKPFLHTRLGSASTTSAANIDVTQVFKDASNASVVTPVVGGSVTLTITFDAINMHFPFIPLPNSGEVERTVHGRIEDTTATSNGCV